MSITIKEIAELVGVSRGTVDRALYDRGRVNPEVARRIKEVAREHGFVPSRVGRALARAKNPIRIGVVVHLSKAPFTRQILRGVERAKEELSNLGAELLLREIPELSVEQQLAAIDELLEEGIHGLALTPVNEAALGDRINKVAAQGIPVVTFNTDLAGSNRMCFVGLDNMRSGRAAAGLMNIITGGQGRVLVITGHLSNQANSQRVEGFLKELEENYHGLTLLGLQICFDEERVAEQITLQSIQNFPDLAGIFMVASGQAGVSRALEQLGMADKIRVVAYDLIPATVEGLRSGAIDFVIDQNVYLQGYRPPMILFNHLFNDKTVDSPMQYTDILYKNKYNL